MTEVPTCCRCCPAGCGIVVSVEGDRVRGVRGDRRHPLSRGYTCPKGRALPDFHHHPARIDQPRRADRAVSWPDVLDDLAGKLRALVVRHGPDSVGVYRATGTSLDTLGRRAAERLVRELGSTQYYSAATVDVAPAWRAAEMVTGSGRELTPVWVPEHPASRFVLFVGCNPVVSHGYLTLLPDPLRRIRAFQRRGGQVWVCDPRTTETARLADGHLAPRPGTDPLLLAWLVRSLLDEGADRHELAHFADPDDLAALRARLAGLDGAQVADRCDLDEGDLDRLLAAVRSAGRIAVVAGTGVTFGRHALVTEWLRWVLLAVTGSLDRPGGMWFNPGWRGALAARERWDHAPPEGRVEPGPRSRPDLPRLFGQNPCAALVDEIESGRLRALLVAGGSPLTAFPDPDRTAAALRALDVLAVVDVVETPLTAMATHVLPATGQLERTDVVAHERTMLAPRAVAPPPGTRRRPCWWIFAQLGHRLGLDALGLDIDLAALDALDAGGEGATAAAGEPALLRALLAPAGDGAGAAPLLDAGPHGVAAPPLYGWVHDRALPDGRWRLVPPGMLDRLAGVLDPPPTPAHARRQPPLRLVSRRQVTANNATRYVPDERAADRPVVLVHADDAGERGIEDGDRVEVASGTGHLTATARVGHGVRRGVVSLPHGWHGTNVCHLTDAGTVDPLTTQPQMSGFAVTLHPADDPHDEPPAEEMP